MSLSNVFYEMTSFSPAIPTLPYLREHSICAEVCSFTKELNPQLIQKANEDAIVLLDREVTILPKSSCLLGLTGGIAASFLLENPLPFFLGLSACFPRAYAQQKVGNEFQVNTFTSSSQSKPSVASFRNGNFVVTWESYEQDGSHYGVYGQLFNGTGSKIGNEFQANSYTSSWQRSSSVASFPNGNFVVTWESGGQDGQNTGIFGQLFDGTGSKIGSEFQVNSYTTSDQCSPSVTSLTDGNFVVTWESDGQDGSGAGVYGQLFNGTGSKIGSEFRVNSYITSTQELPSVASFSNGNFVVTWASDQEGGSTYGVYGQLFERNGTKIGSEFHANTYTADFQRYPSVATFADSNFVVTWQSSDQDGSLNGVFGQLFEGTGNKIESEFQVNTYTTDSQRYPSVASLTNDSFVVTWESKDQDGSLDGVFGQLFERNGSKINNEFQVNTRTLSWQRHSSVASLTNGNFVVTWESRDQDGSGYGVYGQIFHVKITYPANSTTTSFSNETTTKPLTSRNSKSTTLSATSDPRNRFSWIWFLLGGVGTISCFGLTGYFIFKSRYRKKDGNVHAFELGESKQVDDSNQDDGYQYTPDVISAGDQDRYQYTPDVVSAGDQDRYQYTPDVVKAGNGEVD